MQIANGSQRCPSGSYRHRIDKVNFQFPGVFSTIVEGAFIRFGYRTETASQVIKLGP